jgi:hypothetical protein
VSDFSDIILSAANTSLKARTPQRRKNHNNKCKKWYDQSLLDMKNTLDTLSIKLAFNPFDKELRQLCFTMSILKYMLYNKLRKAKRRSYYSDMMFKLNSLSDTNPKAFWDLVNELKYENKSDKGTNLDAPTWENYLKKLNTLSTEKAVLNENFESLLETDRSKDLMNELDFPISAKEVTEAIKKLKKRQEQWL